MDINTFMKDSILGYILEKINLEEFNNNKEYPKCFVEKSSKQLSQYSEEFSHFWSCEIKRIIIYNEVEEESLVKTNNSILFEYNTTNNNSVLFSTVKNIVFGPLNQGQVLFNYFPFHLLRDVILLFIWKDLIYAVVGRWIYISFLIFILS